MQKEREKEIITVEPVKKSNKALIITILIILIAFIFVSALGYLSYDYFKNLEPTTNETINQTSDTNVSMPSPPTSVANETGNTSSSNTAGNTTNGDSDCTPNRTCSYYYNLNRCGNNLDDGCYDILNCNSCLDGKTCNSTGSCVVLPYCTSDFNCTSLTGTCGIGLCNSTGSCYVSYNSSTTVCRSNITECDAVDYCSESSVGCVDNNKTNGAICNGGSCFGGVCVVGCVENWQCGPWSSCVNEIQTRTCNDLNNCDSEEGKPAEQKSCSSVPGTWIPPIGIPTPEFGIEETHRMYKLNDGEDCNTHPSKCYDFGNGLEPYKIGPDGPYTYYIDISNSGCSDSEVYGTYNHPRCTIPYVDLGRHTYIVPLKPGDIIEVHGIHHLQEIRPGGWLQGYEFTGGGTKENPSFVRSDSNNPTIITTNQTDNYGNVLAGSYIILENFEFNNTLVVIRASNSAIRNCEIHNIERTNGRAVSISSAKDFVFYNNNVHHNWGTWPDSSHDMHNIAITGFSERVWVVDNELHHASYNLNGTIAATGGDGIQVMGSYCETMIDPSIWPIYIFIGRNNIHHNTENSVDIKCSHNVVVSQNEAYMDGFNPYSSASMISHEHANNTWFIFNKVHDVRVGIRPEDAIGESFVIGNVIYNIKYPVSSGTIYGNFVGGVWARIVPTHIIGNTFYNITGGTLIPSNSGSCTIINNLVSRVQVPYPGNLSWYHAGVEVGGSADQHTIIDYNLFYQPLGIEEYVPEGVVKLRWGSTVYEGLESFIQSGKCLNCIESNPLFINEENYDFNLQSNSPAIDSGTDEGVVQEIMQKYFDTFGVSIAVDFEGNPRPQGTAWDIGAYEYQNTQSPQELPSSTSFFSRMGDWIKSLFS